MALHVEWFDQMLESEVWENRFDEMELPWAGNFEMQSNVIKCDNLSWYLCLSKRTTWWLRLAWGWLTRLTKKIKRKQKSVSCMFISRLAGVSFLEIWWLVLLIQLNFWTRNVNELVKYLYAEFEYLNHWISQGKFYPSLMAAGKFS